MHPRMNTPYAEYNRNHQHASRTFPRKIIRIMVHTFDPNEGLLMYLQLHLQVTHVFQCQVAGISHI